MKAERLNMQLWGAEEMPQQFKITNNTVIAQKHKDKHHITPTYVLISINENPG